MKHRLLGARDDKVFWECFWICLATAFLSFIYYIISGKGILVIRNDFNRQQIPFITALNDVWQDGLGGWTWNLDLGTSTIQGFSFYELGSPFFWITTLFPREWIPYLVGGIYIIKYVVAGMLSFIYLRRFVKDAHYAVVGALLYAFSGFQASNLLFFHFHDVVAFFPLLLIGLEKIKNNYKDNKVFIFAIFINSLVNYFFFVQEVVFIIIYSIFRLYTKELKELGKRILVCVFGGIWGISMSSVLLIPSFLYIRHNARAEVEFYLSNLVWNSRHFLFILKGFLLPGEAMNDHSGIISSNWDSTSCYIPLVGLVLVFAYVYAKKDWLSKLLKCLCIMSFMPILSSVFLLFTAVYQRWWYMFILMMALASVIVLENVEQYNILKGAVTNACLLILFYCMTRYMKWSDTEGIQVFHVKRFFCYFIVSLTGIVLTWLLVKLKKRRYQVIVICVAAFSVLTTASTLHFYRENSVSSSDYYNEFALYSQLDSIDDQYRYNSDYNVLTLTGKAAGLGSFSSTVADSIWKFDSLFDFYADCGRMDKNEVPGVAQLLGAKYSVTQEPFDGSVIREYTDSKNMKNYVIEKNACPIGYAVQNYILYDELMSIDKEKRGIALLAAPVIESKDEAKVSKIADKVTVGDIDLDKTVDEYVEENKQGAVRDFSRNSQGFICKSNYSEDTMVYFSVPYDSGWTADIDGKQEPIIESGGMMLLRVPEGNHNIQFHYVTPGYEVGKYISIVAILGFVCFCGIDMCRRRKLVKH